MGDVLILLPGTTGTMLVHKGQTPGFLNPAIWPTQVFDAAAVGLQKKALALLEGSMPPAFPPNYAYQVPTQNLLSQPNAYATFIDSFTSDGWTSFVTQSLQSDEVPPDNQPALWNLPASLPQQAAMTFPYDWRQDNTTTAAWFRSFLSSVAGASGGSCSITLVGHSMGGLVARAYLEGIGKDDPLTSNIKRLITLGTPHLGAPLALDAIGDNYIDFCTLGLPESMDTVVWEFVNSSFDSTYELLPPPQIPFIMDGTLKSIFPFSGLSQPLQDYLTNNQFSSGNAQQAATFFASLQYSGPLPYYCAYGDGLPTVTAVGFNGILTDQMSSGGDGIVPTTSAMFTGAIPASQTYNAGAVAHALLPGDAGTIAQVKSWMQG